MSTSVLVVKERQPGSPFGLGQKQAKKQKIRRKCATVARYSMLYRFLCNALQRDGVQPGPDLAFGLCGSVPFHNNSWYGLQRHPPPLLARLAITSLCWRCIVDGKRGQLPGSIAYFGVFHQYGVWQTQ
jgi:hypothetical protein